jgi:hypothetical protein
MLSLWTATAHAEEVGVKLSLDEYEKLRDAHEQPSVAVIESLKLTGTFRARNLGVAITGRSSGKRVAVDVLKDAGAVRLFGCDGDGIVSRTAEGTFTLTPLAAKFSVRCSLSLQTNDRLELETTPSVLWVESAIADGDLVVNDGEDGSRSLSIVRQTSGNADVVALSSTGHYQVSLSPGETAFEYQIDVRNPNRVHQPFQVKPASSEHVRQVDAEVNYDLTDGVYHFDLPPGDSTIHLRGTLPGTRFTPPVEASVQYLLLEAHPLLRLTVPQPPRRISTQETGLRPKFRGAQAFLLSPAEAVTWTTSKLDVLRTTSFAVSEATHHYYVSREGLAVAESRYKLDNQGASDLALPMKALPTFASLNDEPVLMTKNSTGDFWTPLSAGSQELLVQHRQELHHRFGLAWGTLWMPQLAASASRSEVDVRYPSEWQPLVERFRGETRTWQPSESTLMGMAVLIVWTWLVAGAFGLKGIRRGVLAAAAGVTVLTASWAWMLVVLGDVVVSGLVLLPRLRGSAFGMLTAAAVGCVVVYALLNVVSTRSRSEFGASTAALSGEADYRGAARMERSKTLGGFAKSADKVATGAADAPYAGSGSSPYEGLPAKIELPSGARSTWFSAEMLQTDEPRGVQVILMQSWLADLFAGLLGLLALGVIAREYRAIRSGIERLWPHPAPGGAAPVAAT